MGAQTSSLLRAAICAGLVGAASSVVAARAGAQNGPAPVTLEWVTPSGCPSTSAVLAEVERILGPAPAGERKAVAARAVVSRAGRGRWQVALTTRSGAWTGERSFAADSCKALADATALIVALTVDPARVSQVPAAVPAPATPQGSTAGPTQGQPSAAANTSPAPPIATASGTAPQPPPSPPPSPSAAAAPSSPRPPSHGPIPGERERPAGGSRSSTRHLFAIGASASGDIGALPQAAFGGELSLAFTPWRLRLEVVGAYWATETATLPGRPNEGGQFDLRTLGGRACIAVLLRPIELSPCGLLELDHMSAVGFVSGTPLMASADWLETGGGALLTWSLVQQLALRLGVEARVPLARPVFAVQGGPGGGAVHQPSGVGGRGAIGLEFRFF